MFDPTPKPGSIALYDSLRAKTFRRAQAPKPPQGELFFKQIAIGNTACDWLPD